MASVRIPPLLPGEPAQSHEILIEYCLLGPQARTIERAYRTVRERSGKSVGKTSHIFRWAGEWRWQERTEDYDASVAEVTQSRINEEFGKTLVSRLKNFDKCFNLQQEIGKKLLCSIGKLATGLEEKDPEKIEAARKSIEQVRGLSVAFQNAVNALDKTQMQWQNLMGLEQLSERLDGLEIDR